ncbi:MAG: SDR family NAD(P)-dependent oxidoreductase, partial [Gemmatimonadota bacterium]
MKRKLTGGVIAITGASSGIGAATAVACARRGMRVGLFARRADRLEGVAAAVREAGGEAEVVAGDVRIPADQAAFLTALARRWSRLDAVIANAGFGVAARVADTPPAEAREIFDVNVLGSIWTIQAAWPVLEAQRRGHLILISSAAAFHGQPGGALYSATKAAQMNLAEGVRIEARAIGVDVSVVYPIMTTTGFSDAVHDYTGGRKRQAGRKVGGPRQTADDVAAAIVRCLERPRFGVHPYRASRVLPWIEAASP